MELSLCECKKKCNPPSCICMSNGLFCTDMCTCCDCKNTLDEYVDSSDDNDFEFDDDDDNDDEYI